MDEIANNLRSLKMPGMAHFWTSLQETRRYDDLSLKDGLLIIDDFGIKVLDGQQLLDFMEIIEDRHGQKSTIIVSQLPVSNWYDVLKKNTTAADAILDRIVHTAVRFDLKGESMRKKKSTKKSDVTEK